MNILTDLRPTSFNAMVGKSQGLVALQTRIESHGVPQTVLLYGPTGTGKTTTARILAAMVRDAHLTERNAADVNGVEAARELVAIAAVRPLTGKRVIILDECQRLSKDAQDVLLKPTEEPPEWCYWILSTTEPGKISKTLAGRAFKVETEALTKGADVQKLVIQALVHLEADARVDARKLAEKLMASGITSPRAVLEAVEAVATGGKASVPTGESADAFAAVQAYYQGRSAAALKYFRETDTNGIVSWQFIAANYGASMLKAGNGNERVIKLLLAIVEGYPDEAVLRAAWLVAKVAGA